VLRGARLRVTSALEAAFGVMRLSRLAALLLGTLCCVVPAQSQAFTYVVQPGDTLASIAERTYGRIQYEKLLVAANALDVQEGIAIVPGMRLEVPALTHRRIRQGDGWGMLAVELLGAPHRADALAQVNGTSPWLAPEEGSEIVVPYNLRVIVAPTDTIVSIAYKYLGDMNKAWVLDHYNGLHGRKLQRGDVVLVPLTDLPLTPTGQAAAVAAAGAGCGEAAGVTRAVQLQVRDELPALVADVKGGRYVDAVSRGNRFLASGELSHRTLAVVERQLLEAYVALGATGLATAACNAWRKVEPDAKLDAVMVSPKIIAACQPVTPAPRGE
jgi:hypothetical protein